MLSWAWSGDDHNTPEKWIPLNRWYQASRPHSGLHHRTGIWRPQLEVDWNSHLFHSFHCYGFLHFQHPNKTWMLVLLKHLKCTKKLVTVFPCSESFCFFEFGQLQAWCCSPWHPLWRRQAKGYAHGWVKLVLSQHVAQDKTWILSHQIYKASWLASCCQCSSGSTHIIPHSQPWYAVRDLIQFSLESSAYCCHWVRLGGKLAMYHGLIISNCLMCSIPKCDVSTPIKKILQLLRWQAPLMKEACTSGAVCIKFTINCEILVSGYCSWKEEINHGGILQRWVGGNKTRMITRPFSF